MKNNIQICFFYEWYWITWWVKTYIDSISHRLTKDNISNWILSCIESNNNDVVSLWSWKRINIALTVFYFFRLLSFVLKNNVRIFHCQSFYSLILVFFTKKLLFRKFKIISTIHIPYNTSLFTKISTALWIKFIVDDLIGCCKYSLDETMKKDIVSSNNLCSILNWSVIDSCSENVSKDDKILFVWHLTYQKNIELLVRIIKSMPTYDFKIIWDWPDKKLFNNIKNVSVLGVLENKETLVEIKKSKWLILTSRFEALPYVVLEALSFNIPVIASNVWGISELNEFTNQLFLCKNEKKYIEYITKLYNKNNSHVINNIHRIYFEKQFNKYMKIYSKYL